MGNIVRDGNRAFGAIFLAEITAYASRPAVCPHYFTFIAGVTGYPDFAVIGNNLDKIFRANRDTLAAAGAFFAADRSDCTNHCYRPKRAGVLAALKPDAAICA